MVNFFFLSRDLQKCAMWHGDKHLHKMVTEYAQILSTSWHYSVHSKKCDLSPKCDCDLKKSIPKGVYKIAHRKHPTVLWCKSNIKHFRAILRLAKFLAAERRRRNDLFKLKGESPRYSPFHKSEETLLVLEENPPLLPDKQWEDPPLAMPDCYKALNLSSIDAYRLYYACHKVQVAKLEWYPADEPGWLGEYKKKITPEIQRSIDDALTEIKKKRKRREMLRNGGNEAISDTKKRQKSNKKKKAKKVKKNKLIENGQTKKNKLIKNEQTKKNKLIKNGQTKKNKLIKNGQNGKRRSMRLVIKKSLSKF
ncbi:hypothetical protein MHBO_002387 [Bonamia ostreae]|uniref:Uncharacterized protein n=1 Tax=Bonamia ostreae TaxID=126728 RepID=A0ABV2AM40_9EUKA